MDKNEMLKHVIGNQTAIAILNIDALIDRCPPCFNELQKIKNALIKMHSFVKRENNEES